MANSQYPPETIFFLLLASTIALSYENLAQISSSSELSPSPPSTSNQEYPSASLTPHGQDHHHDFSPSASPTEPPSSTMELSFTTNDHSAQVSSSSDLSPTTTSTSNQESASACSSHGQDHLPGFSLSTSNRKPPSSSYPSPSHKASTYHPQSPIYYHGETSGTKKSHNIEKYQQQRIREQDPSPIPRSTVSSESDMELLSLIDPSANSLTMREREITQYLATTQLSDSRRVTEQETDDTEVEGGFLVVAQGGESFDNGVSRLRALLNTLITTTLEHFPAYARGDTATITLYDREINQMLGATVTTQFWNPLTRRLKQAMAPDPSAQGVSPNQAPQVPAMAPLPPEENLQVREILEC